MSNPRKRKLQPGGTQIFSLRQEDVRHSGLATINRLSQDGRRIVRGQQRVVGPTPPPKPLADLVEERLPWNPIPAEFDAAYDNVVNADEEPTPNQPANTLKQGPKTFATLVFSARSSDDA